LDYNTKLLQEIEIYKQVDNIHELPEIFHYMSNKYWKSKMNKLGIKNINYLYLDYIIRKSQKSEICKILSIGAGNCDLEITLGKELISKGITTLFLRVWILILIC
jgi:2-polyprenyl-3-methyl-5-hydroxy-6-metoxy-1,4-benzoquinol methylase